MIRIFTDGACKGNPGPGGWAAVIVGEGERYTLRGREERTTNNRMELTAAIKGLEAVPDGSTATVVSDSEYLVKTMTRSWKRSANRDLWERLDRAIRGRTVRWEWVQAHAGHPENEEADRLAAGEAGGGKGGNARSSLTHVSEEGDPRQVDVGGKEPTRREAEARGKVTMRPDTLRLVREGLIGKGPVLATARIAGIMAAKRTAEFVPLCHVLPLDHVELEVEPDEEKQAVCLTAAARATARTGVEMEALTAVTVAALTVYDMCKAVDRGMHIEDVRLVRKTGGKSGDVVPEE